MRPHWYLIHVTKMFSSNVELQQVKDFVSSLSNDKPSEETDSAVEVATTSSDVWSFFEQAKRSRSEPIQQGENCDDEWGLYIREPPIDRQKSPLTWWGENGKLFPNLAPKAQMLLAIPATEVPGERHWSDAGNNHQWERINASRNLSELLFLRSVLKNIYFCFQKILELDSILGIFSLYSTRYSVFLAFTRPDSTRS